MEQGSSGDALPAPFPTLPSLRVCAAVPVTRGVSLEAGDCIHLTHHPDSGTLSALRKA